MVINRLLAIISATLFISISCGKHPTSDKIKNASDTDCSVCYFRNQGFSNGATSSLNSIYQYKCSSGKWYRVNGGDPTPGEPRKCVPCEFQSEKFSEGAISSLNSVNTYRCVAGEWKKTN